MKFLPPWHSVASGEDFTSELVREVGLGHPLFGVPTKTIARRQDCDDVLFQLEDGTGRVAVVHLTWSGRPEPSSKYPWTVLFDSFLVWAASGMLEDHAEYSDS